MAIISTTELKQAANERLGYHENIDGEFRKALTESRYGKSTSIFLSHSHYDQEVIKEAVVFFRKLGVNIYIDWMDDSMPVATSGTTADRLKKKIKESNKFILLATNNAIASKWCNWELGLGDADKYDRNICIFPLADPSGVWKGSEYLQIYPSIDKKTYSYGRSEYFIVFPDGRKLTLTEWLKSHTPKSTIYG
jgi:hypothetical protein